MSKTYWVFPEEAKHGLDYLARYPESKFNLDNVDLSTTVDTSEDYFPAVNMRPDIATWRQTKMVFEPVDDYVGCSLLDRINHLNKHYPTANQRED